MDTMKSFWRYTWALNRARLITIVAIAVIWPWGMEASQTAYNSGSSSAYFLLPFAGMCFLLLPLLQVGGLIELGREGSPRVRRSFVHTLPVDAGKWALAKLASALAGIVLLPVAALVLGGLTAKLAFGSPGGINQSFAVFVVLVLAGSVWTLLWASLLPHRWVLLGIPLFLGGEAMARRVTSLEALGSVTTWETPVDLALLAVLVSGVAYLLVRYHRNRRTLQTMLFALLVLVVCDGARAWLWR